MNIWWLLITLVIVGMLVLFFTSRLGGSAP